MNESPQDSASHAPSACSGQAERCPLCSGENACHVARGDLYKGPCWCHEIIVPQPVLRRLAETSANPACLCRTCLETVARLSRDRDDVDAILQEVRAAVGVKPVETAPEPDYYLDEFGNTVFTAAYHLKRGNCCGNQCRHCPY